jgi:hypothetical protein
MYGHVKYLILGRPYPNLSDIRVLSLDKLEQAALTYFLEAGVAESEDDFSWSYNRGNDAPWPDMVLGRPALMTGGVELYEVTRAEVCLDLQTGEAIRAFVVDHED